MSRNLFTSLAAALLPLSFAWGAAAGGDLSPRAYGDGPSCDLRIARDGGSLVLEGLVFAPAPVSGSYELVISQGGYAGESNIRQGGDFEIAPGADGSLGSVSLSAHGGYTATLIVHWHDGAPDCTRHVGAGRHL
jgi:hypothetical protein